MKGEEFFGEVKEERLIDEDLSWTEFWGSVVVLGGDVSTSIRLKLFA